MRTGHLALIITLCLLAGCGRTYAGGGEDVLRPQQERDLTLTVKNQNFYDATLYAIREARRVRLGRVEGNTERSFDFRWDYYDLRIEIDLLSVGSYFTQQMMVEPGDALELLIEPALDRRIRLRRP